VFATFFLQCWKFRLMLLSFVFQICCCFRGSAFSIAISVMLILNCLGLLPFSGVIVMILFLKSMSVHCSCHASPHLAPVSFSIWRNVAVLCPLPAMSWSSSVSVGMNGCLFIRLYFGGFHWSPCIMTKLLYAFTALSFLPSHQVVCLAIPSFTDSGFSKSTPLFINTFSRRIRGSIVESLSPCFFMYHAKSNNSSVVFFVAPASPFNVRVSTLVKFFVPSVKVTHI